MASSAERMGGPSRLKRELRALYDGSDKRAIRFRWTLFAIDMVTIALFVEMTFLEKQPWMIVLEMVLGCVLLLELSARLYISHAPLRRLMRPLTWIDIVVIASLLAAPFVQNLGFFRILRALRLFRSAQVLAPCAGCRPGCGSTRRPSSPAATCSCSSSSCRAGLRDAASEQP
jgi:hypothetical protein